jgi:hypothetical protein
MGRMDDNPLLDYISIKNFNLNLNLKSTLNFYRKHICMKRNGKKKKEKKKEKKIKLPASIYLNP